MIIIYTDRARKYWSNSTTVDNHLKLLILFLNVVFVNKSKSFGRTFKFLEFDRE